MPIAPYNSSAAGRKLRFEAACCIRVEVVNVSLNEPDSGSLVASFRLLLAPAGEATETWLSVEPSSNSHESASRTQRGEERGEVGLVVRQIYAQFS